MALLQRKVGRSITFRTWSTVLESQRYEWLASTEDTQRSRRRIGSIKRGRLCDSQGSQYRNSTEAAGAFHLVYTESHTEISVVIISCQLLPSRHRNTPLEYRVIRLNKLLEVERQGRILRRSGRAVQRNFTRLNRNLCQQ